MNPSNRNPQAGGAGGPEGRLERFEALLRQDVDASRVDWEAMEKALRARIEAAEAEGPLLALKADIIPPADFQDRLETRLFAHIRDHREYQEPVDDVISGAEGLSQSHWQRLESKLDERIRAASQLAPWEQALKAGEDLAPGKWEGLEQVLRNRMDQAAGSEPWELALKADEVPTAGALESVETGLLARMDSLKDKPAWERVLKAERALPPGRWEAMEEKLQARIERERKLAALSHQPFWLSLGFFLSRSPAKVAAAMVVMLGLLAGTAKVYQDLFRPIDTLIYQAQGTSAGDLDSALSAGRLALQPGRPAVQAKEDGAMVMVNRRGFVDLRNGSRLKIREANRRKVHYDVAFAGERAASGNVTFFVNKAKGGEKFLVSTPDYRIEVLGTYFRVDPDLGGRVTTAVLEGKVIIRSRDHGDFTVEAGQSLAYDPATGKYRVLGGGRSVAREEIETLPAMDELRGFGVLSVTSDIPQAEVRLDGRYRGVTPLVVLVAPGPHSLHLSRDGYSAYDTLVSVDEGATRRLAALLPALPKATEAAPAAARAPRKPAAQLPVQAAAPEAPPAPTASVMPEGVASLFHRADEAQAADWRAAIELYAQVLEHPQASTMRKEAARFSIARLRAEHESDKSRAKEEFLSYLALHPDGAFAGESWLRLAELEVGRDPEKAIEYYLRCIAKFPRHHRLAELQHRVGLIYLQTRRYDEAIGMFRQSLGNVLYNSESERRRIYGSLYRAYVAKGDRRSAELIGAEYRPSDLAAPR